MAERSGVAVCMKLLVGATLLACLFSLHAEEVIVSGRVVDETRKPVPGIRIIVALASAPQSRDSESEAISDTSGQFTLRLAPGSYQLSAEGEGFFALRGQRLDVVESTNSLEVMVSRVRQTSESVNVTATLPPVDVQGTTMTRGVSDRQILEIPYPSTRNFRNALRIVPGIVQDQGGNLHFDGAMENQVMYSLNGFNVGNPVTGRLTTRLPVEAVRSLDYSSGRYSPEFGKGSAGTLAIQTTSGDDRFRYSLTNFIPGIETQTGFHIGTWSPRFAISGPIRRGRAWFSETIDAEYNQAVIPDLPAGENRTTRVRGGSVLHSQVNLTPTHLLFVDFLNGYENAPRQGISALDPRSTSVDRGSTQLFWSIKDQVYWRRGFIFETGFAQSRGRGYERPQGDDFYVITPNGRGGNYFVHSTQWSQRDQFLFNTYLPSFEFAGVHHLKIGFDADRLDFRQQAQRTGYEHYDSKGRMLSRTTFAGNGSLRLRNTELSSYITDAWDIGSQVRLEYGLRQDWDALVRRILISPRIGAAWAPSRWRSTRIAAGYAVTYDASNLAIFSRPMDQYGVTTSYGVDGTSVLGPAVTLFRAPANGRRAPRYQNWTFGVEQQLPARIRLSFSFLRRRGLDGFTYASDSSSLTALTPADTAAYLGSGVDAMYVLTNLRRDTYDSASVTLHQPFGKEYEWMLNYTRSRALSNAVIDISIDQPFEVRDNLGRLSWDAPNRLLSWGYLPTGRRNWALAYLLDLRSGFPFSVQSQTGEIIGGVNSRRFPTNCDLNLHIERRFKLGRHRFAIRAGVNNVTNSLNATGVNNVIDSPNFLAWYGREGRHAVFRLRWLNKE